MWVTLKNLAISEHPTWFEAICLIEFPGQLANRVKTLIFGRVCVSTRTFGEWKSLFVYVWLCLSIWLETIKICLFLWESVAFAVLGREIEATYFRIFIIQVDPNIESFWATVTWECQFVLCGTINLPKLRMPIPLPYFFPQAGEIRLQYYMAHGSVHKMVRSDWLVAGPYFRVRTREMDPVRWTAPNNSCRKLRSCMSDSGCVILTEPEESYKNILRKSTLWHPFCKTTAKSTEEVS